MRTGVTICNVESSNSDYNKPLSNKKKMTILENAILNMQFQTSHNFGYTFGYYASS